MSFIAPDGDIVILKNIPLDAGYKNTISFRNAEEQLQYFLNPSRVKATLTRQYYTRIENGVIRAQVFTNDEGVSGADYYRDCNYLCFTNNATLETSGYSHKWYFAFITSISYVNNSVAEIRFQLDVMQTWAFNYALKDSFVEREHSASDLIGEHVLPEPLDATQYVNEWVQYEGELGMMSQNPHIPGFDSWSVIVWATFNQKYEDYQAQISGSMYNGLCANVFTGSSAQGLASAVNEWLNGAVEAGKEEGIVAINMFPTQFLQYQTAGSYDSRSMSSAVSTRTLNVQRTPSWGGANIRNNKLYSYPYTMLTLQTHNGDTLHLRYEWFPSNRAIELYMRCALSPTPQCDISPMNYAAMTGINPLERLAITNFPQCAYNTDAYKAWMAQNSVSIGISTVSSLLGVATSAFTAGQMITGGSSMLGTSWHENLSTGRRTETQSGVNPIGNTAQGFNRANNAGLISSAINTGTLIANNANAIRLASIQPPIARGNQSNLLDVAYGRFGFYVYQTHLAAESALAVDDFFTRFGYATQRVKVPNTRVRQGWTYVKTNGCFAVPNTNAGLPSDDLTKICQIFDAGITFWRYTENMDVGNYEQDNLPLGQTEQHIIVSPQALTVRPGQTFSISASVGYSHLSGEHVSWNHTSPYLEQIALTWDETTGTSVLTLKVDEETPGMTAIEITATNTLNPAVTDTCRIAVNIPIEPEVEVTLTTQYDSVSCVCGYTLIQNVTVSLTRPGDNTVSWSIRSTGSSGSNSTDGIILQPISTVVSDFNPLISTSSCGIICNTYALPGDYVVTITSNQDNSVTKEINLRVTSNNMKVFYVMKSAFKSVATPVRNQENQIVYWYYIILNDDYNMAYGLIGNQVATQFWWAKLRETTSKGQIDDPSMVDGLTQDAVIVRPIDNSPTNNGRACVYITNHLLESLVDNDHTATYERIALTYPMAAELNSAGLLSGDEPIEILTQNGNTICQQNGDEIYTEEINAQYIEKDD